MSSLRNSNLFLAGFVTKMPLLRSYDVDWPGLISMRINFQRCRIKSQYISQTDENYTCEEMPEAGHISILNLIVIEQFKLLQKLKRCNRCKTCSFHFEFLLYIITNRYHRIAHFRKN